MAIACFAALLSGRPRNGRAAFDPFFTTRSGSGGSGRGAEFVIRLPATVLGPVHTHPIAATEAA